MGFVHVVAESEYDAAFYVRCLERITGRVLDYRMVASRKGSDVYQAMRMARMLLRQIRRTGSVDDTFFLITRDNDRSPIHPSHEQLPGLSEADQRKPCAFCTLFQAATDELGEPTAWPIGGAIAVPVQMIESWLLLIRGRGEQEGDLPPFSTRSQPEAQRFYGRAGPPPQLKDLTQEDKIELGLSHREYLDACAEALDPNDLKRRSPSFALFLEQVEGW